MTMAGKRSIWQIINVILAVQQVLFLGLKLASAVTWSWWVVFVPSMVGVFVACWYLFFMIYMLIEWLKR